VPEEEGGKRWGQTTHQKKENLQRGWTAGTSPESDVVKVNYPSLEIKKGKYVRTERNSADEAEVPLSLNQQRRKR